MKVNWDDDIPNEYGTNKIHVPDHQPVVVYSLHLKKGDLMAFEKGVHDDLMVLRWDFRQVSEGDFNGQFKKYSGIALHNGFECILG